MLRGCTGLSRTSSSSVRRLGVSRLALSSEGMPPMESCSRAKSLPFLRPKCTQARRKSVRVLGLRAASVFATLAAMKEVPMSDVCGAGPEDADSPPDPLHHRQRRLRALQLLRDAQHPDGVPRHVAAHVSAGRRSRGRGEGRLPHLRHRRLLFPAARRLAGRSFLWQIQHDLLAQPRLLRSAIFASRSSSRTAPASTPASR